MTTHTPTLAEALAEDAYESAYYESETPDSSDYLPAYQTDPDNGHRYQYCPATNTLLYLGTST